MRKHRQALEASVLSAVQPGDVLMVKGSLGSRMGPLVKALERQFSRPARQDAGGSTLQV